MKNADAADDIRNDAARRVGEIVRNVRLHEMVLILIPVAQVQILTLDTESLRHLSADGAADSCVIDVFTKDGATEYDLAFHPRPLHFLALLCKERSRASH